VELKYSEEQRKEYLKMIDLNGQNWLHVFQGNAEFYSAAYWDLLTAIWRQNKPVRKTDALKMMVAIKSPQTAAKYVETALQHDFLIEQDNPSDARSKLVALSPDMRQRLDILFDKAVAEVCNAYKNIDSPIPEKF
jgi:hypothetical protein